MTHSPPSSGLGDQAQDTMSQVVDQAQQTTGQVAEQAKQQATSQLESQKQRAVDSLVTVAQALRQTGQQLHQQEQPSIAGYVDQAAQRVETLTNHLRSRDVPTLLSETEGFARRNPGVFIGTAMVLGFLGGRFLRSSGQRAAGQQPPGFATTPGSMPPYDSVASGSTYTRPGYAYDALSAPMGTQGAADL